MQPVGHLINWREPGRCFLDKDINFDGVPLLKLAWACTESDEKKEGCKHLRADGDCGWKHIQECDTVGCVNK